MMQCLVLVDSQGEPLRPSIQYNDARAKAEAEALESLAGGADALASQTVNWKGPLALPPKLRWLLDHEPEAVAKAALMLLGAHDFVALRLCGARVTDAVT